MFTLILANVDVRGNLVVCAILLVLGVVVLRFLRPTSATSGSRRWLPIAAFVAGPLVAFLWSLAEDFCFSPTFTSVFQYTSRPCFLFLSLVSSSEQLGLPSFGLVNV
ncbi:hypothetical protein OAF56_02960 [Pirellulaceae bacterium]|nr:hypothetical protein [Pirellulaceae bacterium]